MRRALFPVDWIMAGYFAIITAFVLIRWDRMDHPERFLLLHGGMIGGILLVAWMHRLRDVAPTRVLHYWLPAPVTLAAYLELSRLVPAVHPRPGREPDWFLHSVDVTLLGDVEAFCGDLASRPMADLMYVFYAAFYFLPPLLFAVLYSRQRHAAFRDTASVLFLGWYLTYLGYFAVPVLGPHLVTDGPRAPHLDGLVWGRWIYVGLLGVEGGTPDAFPSGHALVTVLTLVMAWRHARDRFWWMLPFGIGLVLSTVYLRYHYAVDILAALALVPVAVVGGTVFARWWERPATMREGRPLPTATAWSAEREPRRLSE